MSNRSAKCLILGNSSTVELRTLTPKASSRFQELSSRPKRLTAHVKPAKMMRGCLTFSAAKSAAQPA